jgi:hypothetical protein
MAWGDVSSPAGDARVGLRLNENIEAHGTHRVRPCLQARIRRLRVETEDLDLLLRSVARLAQEQEPGLQEVRREEEEDWGR